MYKEAYGAYLGNMMRCKLVNSCCCDLTRCLTENVGVATHIFMLFDEIYILCSNETMRCDDYDAYDAYGLLDGY